MNTRKALLFSFIDRYSGLVISVVSSMVIARLLRPDELGIFSVAVALLMLASTVRDMGAGQYLVQAPSLTDGRIRAVWTIQFGVGMLLAAIVAGLAVPAAVFYKEPQIQAILLVMAVNYLVNPVGSITYAMLMREMAFGQVAVMRLASASTNAVVSIALALTDHGPISLAWGNLAGTCANALAAQFFRSKDMAWGFNLGGVPEVLGFSGRLTVTSLLNTTLGATPDFALGKLQGMHQAGLYSRANGLVAMFSRLVTDAVYNVALSLFARQRRDGVTVAPGFLRALSYVCALNWAFSINLMLLAHPITRLLYGSGWDDSVLLTRWLAMAGALLAPVPICIAISTAMGRADLVMRCSFAGAMLSAGAALFGALHSLETMGQALAVAGVLISAIWLGAATRTAHCAWGELFATLTRSLGVAVVAALAPVAVVIGFGLEPARAWPALAVAVPIGALALLLGLALFSHPLADELHPLIAKLRRKASP
jgi:O-antigen/teichoic acid export membrane protein